MDPTILVILSGLNESMKAIKELTRDRGGQVSVEFLEAQQRVVNQIADISNDLDKPLPGESGSDG